MQLFAIIPKVYLDLKGDAKKKGTRTFSHSSFWGPNFVFLINLPKNRHKKVSDEVLYISVGHLSPEIYQILSKIDFPKNMNFVKKKLVKLECSILNFFECKRVQKWKSHANLWLISINYITTRVKHLLWRILRSPISIKGPFIR